MILPATLVMPVLRRAIVGRPLSIDRIDIFATLPGQRRDC
jgi:hypothetical protein